ncbi:MAG: hypothetical protein FWD62_08915 [Betaproteobacteria bacterium]|nr:hypothetical protein [Betaproteobacteria bacterium]
MAKSDFFRNIPIELATELEALARLQYELRESYKALLAQYGEKDIESLRVGIVNGKHPTSAAVDAVRAAVIGDECMTVHAALAAQMKGEASDIASPHTQIAALIDTHYGRLYPGGPTRRFDAIELLDINGIARILRFSANDFWSIEWGADEVMGQSLTRLPHDSVLHHKTADGFWQTVPLSDAPDSSQEVLLNWLLHKT